MLIKKKDLCSHFSVQALPTLFFIPVGGKPIIEVGATPGKVCANHRRATTEIKTLSLLYNYINLKL